MTKLDRAAGGPSPNNGRIASRVAIILAILAQLAVPARSFGQDVVEVWPLIDLSGLEAHEVEIAPSDAGGRRAIRVRLESDFDGGDSNTMAILSGSDFLDGTIEVDLLSRVDPKAWFFVRWFARGFVGLAFRADRDLGRFESLYLRPANGRVEDEDRRAHVVQYFSYPDWDFSRFRKESPGDYEGEANIGLDEWIHVRIEVRGDHAELFINEGEQPVLVVNDLKHGPDQRGGIGLWVDAGTIALFSNLTITHIAR